MIITWEEGASYRKFGGKCGKIENFKDPILRMSDQGSKNSLRPQESRTSVQRTRGSKRLDYRVWKASARSVDFILNMVVSHWVIAHFNLIMIHVY